MVAVAPGAGRLGYQSYLCGPFNFFSKKETYGCEGSNYGLSASMGAKGGGRAHVRRRMRDEGLIQRTSVVGYE